MSTICYGDKPDIASSDGSWKSVLDSDNGVNVSIEYLHDKIKEHKSNEGLFNCCCARRGRGRGREI